MTSLVNTYALLGASECELSSQRQPRMLYERESKLVSSHQSAWPVSPLPAGMISVINKRGFCPTVIVNVTLVDPAEFAAATVYVPASVSCTPPIINCVPVATVTP